ncbi:MAG: hypothetical protein ACE145_06930 [Terriglobia bacterium]
MGVEPYRESLLEYLISALFARSGEPGTLTGEGKPARFEIKKSLGGGSCEASCNLEFALPSGRVLSHVSDIVIRLAGGKTVAVELQWATDLEDQLKARAFDVLHLKQALGQNFTAFLIYLRAGLGGLSAEHAREICYPFDHFIALEHQDPQNPTIWVSVLDRIEAEMKSR